MAGSTRFETIDREFTGRIPPQAQDVEMAVIGAMLRDAEAVTQVRAILQETDFYKPAHRRIYAAICSLDDAKEPVDLKTVVNELERTGDLDKIGGRVPIIECADSIFTSVNAASHARIVSEKAALRSLITTTTGTSEKCYTAPGSVDDLIADTQAQIDEIQRHRLSAKDDFRPMMDVALEASAFVDKLHAGGPLGISKTGLRNLDEKIGALRPKDYVIIAGRTSMGKTALATKIVSYVAAQDVPVAFFSLEMGDVPLVIRMACEVSKVSLSEILKGMASEKDVTDFGNALSKVSKYPIFWDKVPAMNPAGLRVKCEKAVRQHKARVIVLDYIQLMNGPKKAENREKEVAAISRTCKGIARDLDVCFIGLSQLKRNGDQRPSLSDLRDSGALEQDADIVLFPWREIPKNANDNTTPALIDVAKQRNGPIGDCPCQFHLRAVSFENEGYDG